MRSLLKDLAYAVRSLRQHRAFTVTAILTLALGIGPSTAIFSVVNAVLLRPLPYARSEQLALIWIDMRARGVTDFPFSVPGLKDFRDQSTTFSDVGGLFPFRTPFAAGTEHPEQVRALGATTNLLAMLGARVAFGRDFTESDGYAPPTPPAPPPGSPPPPPPTTPPLPAMIILNHAYWERHFGGDSSVIGRTVDLAGAPGTIVGVLEPGFEMLYPPNANVDPNPDMVIAARIDFVNSPRFNTFLRLVGRMKPGVTLAAARADAEQIAADSRSKYDIAKSADAHYRVELMSDDLVADVRPAILALMGAVTFVLLIACANVANLQLVRAAARERELSIRAALGGSPARLVRQLLAESAVLAGAGAATGVALAYGGIKLLVSLAPANLPRLDEVRLDPAVLAFTVVLAVVAAALFGVIPAIRASRPDLADVLRASGRAPNLGGRTLLRNVVVAAEVALSFVLLVGGGLMVRSFITLAGTNPGFDPNGVLTFTVGIRGSATPDQRRAYVEQLRAGLGVLPGVVAVTAAAPLPLDGGLSQGRWGPEEAAQDQSKFQQANLHVVLPGYFEAMRGRLLDGRTLTEADNSPQFTGVVIDSLLAAKAFHGERAVGRKLLVRTRSLQPELLEIIGVVAHQRHTSLATDGHEAIFLPDQFFGPGTVGRWAVRIACPKDTRCDPAALGPAARKVATELDPQVTIAEMQPMTAFVDRAMSGTRFALVLIAAFAGIAVILACIGMYGVLSTAVRQRTAEIGVRMTYGATSRSIFGLVIGDGMKLSVLGLGAGVAGAFVLTRVMRSMLVGVQPTDPTTYAVMLLVFLGVTAVACWMPARRAAGLDPAAALRSE